MILNEPDDNRIAEKAAIGNGLTRWKRIGERVGGVVRIGAAGQQALQRKRGDSWGAGEGEEASDCVCRILKAPTGECPDGAAAGGNLAGKQWSWDDPVEQPKARSDDDVARRAEVVGEAYARIEVLPLRVQHGRWPSLPFPANPAVERKAAGGAPFILEVKTVIGVGKLPKGLVANRR